MNENLSERISRGKGIQHAQRQPDYGRIAVVLLPPKLNPLVFDYYKGENRAPTASSSWLSQPEIPTADELSDPPVSTTSSQSTLVIPVNRPLGSFHSKEEYLATQYELLREAAVRPLREACESIRDFPTATEDAFGNKYGLYDRVRMSALVPSTRGLAVKVTFSIARTGKKIIWEQSKRLITGSLVLLIPCTDMLRSSAPIVATVASRHSEDIKKNPPELHLYIADWKAIEVDPAQEFLMIEARSSYFEGDRHTLLALQHMSMESFPLARHLVNVQPNVELCAAVRHCSLFDLSTVFGPGMERVDIQEWKGEHQSIMDPSQLDALLRMLTKVLAVIQGPPGTGKTWTSVQAVKLLLANRKRNDPPILIIAQTNHAVDQIARHVLEFEPDLVRLGGMSKDKVVQKRSLYHVRAEYPSERLPGSQFGSANAQMRSLEKELEKIIGPLTPSDIPLDVLLLQDMDIISHSQAQSIINGAAEWKNRDHSDGQLSPMEAWLADELVPVPSARPTENFDFPFEEADVGFEELMEDEQEGFLGNDDSYDKLMATKSILLCDNFTGRKVYGRHVPPIAELLQMQDMYAIDETYRGTVYRYFQQKVKEKLQTQLRAKAQIYNQCAAKRKIGGFERDETILKGQKVIAMTTTGFSKYRGLICALKPKIILCEEAAEVLEAPVAVACIPSLEQLILVGDHKQLRPHVQCREFEDQPYYLNLSLFERLVMNHVEFTTLAVQRRMIPEVRRNLAPIYGDLIKDHASVLDPANRAEVPGMGGVNSFWFTHKWPEARNNRMSSYNSEEAAMMVGFVQYLLQNGVQLSQITCLTFYNGQREELGRLMDKNDICREMADQDKAQLVELNKKLEPKDRLNNIKRRGQYKIVTVDSYQGEENSVVLLSLTRSNMDGKIGFLENQNRACVALSRARCGFYIFGDGMLLHGASDLWKQVVVTMSGRQPTEDTPRHMPHRLDTCLPICCMTHGNTVEIREPCDWEGLDGGCGQPCGERLLCGHTCEFKCHPFEHEPGDCEECPRPENLPDQALHDVSCVSTPQREQPRSDPHQWTLFSVAEPERIIDVSNVQTSTKGLATAMSQMHLSHDSTRTVTKVDQYGNKRVLEEYRVRSRSPNKKTKTADKVPQSVSMEVDGGKSLIDLDDVEEPGEFRLLEPSLLD